jgi:formylglycine-generating enzyme required for sulfatase activity/serine/threonine protein kinase
MPRDDDQSLGGEQTFSGKVERDVSPQSLGDDLTFGDAGGGDESFDDGMELVDLSSRYKVEGTLGKGGMGEVLLATDTRLNRKVAIKRVLGDAAKSQTAVQRFLTEAQSIAALNHFNIVQIHDYGRDQDGPFLIMEHVDGGSLLDKCREGALPLDEAVELTCQLCDGLSKAHDAGIIHRDIKPANVLITSDGAPKLTDFGLARQDSADTGQTMAGAVLGTLDFMPPEQRKDATQADARSDLWSLAATFYQMVTGKSPKVIRLSDVPESLQDVLGKALEEAPAERYQSADEFRQALQTAAQESSGGPARDLKTGECRSCGHGNDPGRKFCQSCGGPLTEACLSCDHDNGVWETFCGGCGANQEQLADSKITELSEQRSRVDSLCREYRYDDALQLVGQLADQSHPRFAEFPVWAQETRPQIEREYAEAKAERERLVGEARSLMSQQEYTAVPRLFESLAKGLWNSEVQGLIVQAEQSDKEAAALLTEIKGQVRDRSYKGLLEKTERFLELRPDRDDIREIHATLSKRAAKRAEKQSARDKVRSAEILDEVRERMREKDFASVVMLLEDLPEGYETQESLDLQRKAQIRVEQSEKLLKQIDQAVKKGQTSRLLPKLDDYLKLVSTDERIESLREKLVDQQRAFQRKVKAGVAGVCVLVLAVTVGMYLNSRAEEKTQTIAAAVESQSWDTVLTLDSGNTQALLGRAQNRLDADPPDFDGALADLQSAEYEDPQTEGLSSLKATVYARRAGVQADADQIDKAEADLKEAQALELASAELAGVRGKLAGAHLRKAQGLAEAGQLEQALAARDKAVTCGADAAALQPLNDGLADAYVKLAVSLTLTSNYPAALDAVESAKLLNAGRPQLSTVEAEVYVQRARTSLKDGDRDKASADFLLARKLDGKALGLGELAAGLADGLVQRCEDAFTDAAFQEATAALATVTELEPDSQSLPGLKDRLGKVLVSQGDAALADGSLPRVGAIIESLQTLGVLPDDQTRLADGLFMAASDALTAALEKQDLPSVTEGVRLINGLDQVPQEQRDQAVADAVTPLSQMLLDGLKGDQPQAAATAITDLIALMPELTTVLQDGVKELSDEVKSLLPAELRQRMPPSWLKDGLVAYYPFNGNAKDESGNGNDGAITGAVLSADRHIASASAIAFHADGDVVTVPPSASLNAIESRTHTVAMWLRPDTSRKQSSSYVVSRNTGRSDQWFYLFDFNTTPTVVARTGHRSAKPRENAPLSTSIPGSEWVHVVFATNETRTAIFIDGRQKDEGSPGLDWPDVSSAALLFGHTRHQGKPANQFYGKLDDVRIYNRALSATEVKALYDYESRTPQPDFTKGLVAYYPFNGNAKDESGNGHDGKVTGANLAPDRHGDARSAYHFVRSADAIYAKPGTSLYPHSKSIVTYTLWFRLNALTEPHFLSVYPDRNTKDGPNRFFIAAEGSNVYLANGEKALPAFATTKIPLHTWQHIVVEYNYLDAIAKVWHNSTLLGETKLTVLSTPPLRQSLRIGSLGGNPDNPNLLIDDVRIYNRALSAEEVKTLYEYESQPPGQPVGQAPPPAVAPFDATQAKAHQQAWADHLGVPVETTNSIGMKFVVIPAGEFMMGSPEDEPGHRDDETLHKVTLTQPFQIGMHEVTQEQYQKVMGTNPSDRKGPQNPVEMVSWNDAVEFCRKLSEQPEEKAAGSVYRLPTEAQWEYTCRAGTTTGYSFGDSESELGDYARYLDNSQNTTHPVGQKKPNAWGLYDMHGNVFEWCQDWYGDYPSGLVTDPTGPISSDRRVLRGGSFYNQASHVRSARRANVQPDYRGADLGFRPARTYNLSP